MRSAFKNFGDSFRGARRGPKIRYPRFKGRRALSHRRGRWHVALSVELPDPTPAERTDHQVVGVDLGIKSLAVLSTGEIVPNPRHLDGALTAWSSRT